MSQSIRLNDGNEIPAIGLGQRLHLTLQLCDSHLERNLAVEAWRGCVGRGLCH